MGTATTKASARAVSRFKQICCLGLPSQLAMPALLQVLHDVVPSYANLFFWGDASGQVTNALFENMSEVAPLIPLYFSEFHNKRQTEVFPSFTEVMARQGVIEAGQMLKVDARAYRRHDLYNQIFRPAHCADGLWGVVRDVAHPLGTVQIYREPNAPAFSPSDLRQLDMLLPYLGHALAVPEDAPVRFTEGEDEGLLIVDERASIRYQSTKVRQLLYFVTHPNIADDSFSRGAGRDLLHAGLAKMILQLKASTGAGSASEYSRPPVWWHRNAWGEFVFRAYWLDEMRTSDGSGTTGVAPEPARLIGVSVRHNEPLALKLLRRLDGLALTPRQREVGLWLAQGLSFAEVATRLNASERTVEGHARDLYDKLYVHNRAELVNALLV